MCTWILAACLLVGVAQTESASEPRVPSGFEIHPVAAPPLVQRPVHITLDERGRMFVFDSSGDNLPNTELIKKLPHRVLLLEDTNDDGVFDTSKVYADKLTMPMGLLWHDGALYVAAPPNLYKFEDTDGDDVADRRTVVLGEFGWIGNAASIHGPYIDPNGYFYLNKSGRAHRIVRPDGTVEEGSGVSGMIRFRKDGSQLERFCGGGMDNPCSATFTPEGEIIAVLTFYNYPNDGSGKRDAMVHFVEGGAYPKKNPTAAEQLVFTGDWMPPISHFGVFAPAAVEYYRGASFGDEYVGNVFTAQFNVRRVQRHILDRHGATFRATDEDFVVSDNPDFHPTDVKMDADGSLLVVDTGGWFRKGCPTSQIAKPDILGAIYRVRRKGAAKINDPCGVKLRLNTLSASELVNYLDGPRPVVYELAVRQLSACGPAAVTALNDVLDSADRSVNARRNAVWALSQIDAADAQKAIRSALNDASPSVRIAACRSIGLSRDSDALPRLLELAVSDTPPVRREAATSIGRICEAGRTVGSQVSRQNIVTALLGSLGNGDSDRFLVHALIYAAIRIADHEATVSLLSDAHPAVQRAALIALDQMQNSCLNRQMVMPLLNTDDVELLNTAFSIVSRRPEWSDTLHLILHEWLITLDLSPQRKRLLADALLNNCRQAGIQKLIADSLDQSDIPLEMRLLLLETIQRSALDVLPPSWIDQLGKALNCRNSRVQRQAIHVVRHLGVVSLDGPLRRIAESSDCPSEVRIDALLAAASRLDSLEDGMFDFLLRQLNDKNVPMTLLAAARALSESPLTENQLMHLTAELPDATPMTLPVLLEAYSHSQNAKVGKALIAALSDAAAAESLSVDDLATVLKGFPEEVRAEAKPLTERLSIDLEQRSARLEELSALLSGGDPERGRVGFFGSRAACSSCHTISGEGGRIGPNLTGIGSIRSGRDLLEAIVFPSASFARGFRPYLVVTTNGRVYSGLISQRTADAIFMQTSALEEIRIPTSDIEEIQESSTSIMPQGLDLNLTKDELQDVLAFLRNEVTQ